MSTPSTDPQPRAKIYRLMDSQSEAHQAIDEVLAHAKQDLMIFDQSPKALRERGFDRPQNIEIMRQLLLASHNSRARHIRIALHETQGIEGEVPRLLSLLDQFSDLLAIRRTQGDARNVQDVMVIADTDALWRKPVATHARSIATLHDAHEVKPYLDRFEEIWQLTENKVTARTTGL